MPLPPTALIPPIAAVHPAGAAIAPGTSRGGADTPFARALGERRAAAKERPAPEKPRQARPEPARSQPARVTQARKEPDESAATPSARRAEGTERSGRQTPAEKSKAGPADASQQVDSDKPADTQGQADAGAPRQTPSRREAGSPEDSAPTRDAGRTGRGAGEARTQTQVAIDLARAMRRAASTEGVIDEAAIGSPPADAGPGAALSPATDTASPQAAGAETLTPPASSAAPDPALLALAMQAPVQPATAVAGEPAQAEAVAAAVSTSATHGRPFAPGDGMASASTAERAMTAAAERPLDADAAPSARGPNVPATAIDARSIAGAAAGDPAAAEAAGPKSAPAMPGAAAAFRAPLDTAPSDAAGNAIAGPAATTATTTAATHAAFVIADADKSMRLASARAGGTGNASEPIAPAAGLSAGLSAPAMGATPHSTLHAGAPAASAPYTADVAGRFGTPAFAPSLAASVSVLARDGIQEARLNLHPAEMGPIAVQIALDGTQARVDFTAEVAGTRAAIEAGLPELASALRESGLTLAGGGVYEQAREQRESPGQGQTSTRSGNGGRGDAAPPEPASAPLNTAALRRIAAGGVDTYA